MGGGTTEIGVFLDGVLVHADCIPVGGVHVTSDLARGLTTPVTHAERIKTLYGSCVATSTDDRELIDVPQVGEYGEDEPVQANHLPRSLLVGIIQPRLEETFELVRQHLEISGFYQVAGRRVVLTGGGSQLTGLPDVARRILARNVRIGRPMGVSGLPTAAKGPAFSTAVGLMIYPQVADMETHAAGSGLLSSLGGNNSRFARVGQWLKESF